MRGRFGVRDRAYLLIPLSTDPDDTVRDWATPVWPPLLDALDDPWSCTAFGRLDEALSTLAAATADPRLRRHVRSCRQDRTAEHPDRPLPAEIRMALERYDRP